MFFSVKQKTAYEMRISDWSSDVCSSDLHERAPVGRSRFEIKLVSGDALRHNNGSTVLGIPKRLQNVRQTQAVVRGRRQFVEELRRRRVGQRDCAVHITDNGSIRKLLHPDRKSTRLNSTP